MNTFVFGLLSWLAISLVVAPILGRAIAIADRRDAAMRIHPCIASLDFDQHTAQALAIGDLDRQERQHFDRWEADLRGDR